MIPDRKLGTGLPQTGCCRPKSGAKMRVEDAGFDAFESGCLEIMRFYFLTFGDPTSQSWMRALELSYTHFPSGTALLQSVRVLAVVQAMRRSRKSVFCFSSPTCPDCAELLSDAERHLMATIHCVRIGRAREAQTYAMLLCEGNDTLEFLEAVHVMCIDVPNHPANLRS